MYDKIGIGIITCNRSFFFKELIQSIPAVDSIVVVNDGTPYENSLYINKVNKLIQHTRHKNIGESKNEALQYLLENKCNHIFLLEDDIALLDGEIIEKYIKASQSTGILHFNYAYHGYGNRDANGNPLCRKILAYDNDVRISFHERITGALTYFRDTVLMDVGLMDGFYRNVHEHVDHTYRIIKAGYHPPFRWFADLADSFKFVKELDPTLKESINRKSSLSLQLRANFFSVYFKMKFGKFPWTIPDTSESEVLAILQKLKERYTNNNLF